jgi:hypothetical protein
VCAVLRLWQGGAVEIVNKQAEKAEKQTSRRKQERLVLRNGASDEEENKHPDGNVVSFPLAQPARSMEPAEWEAGVVSLSASSALLAPEVRLSLAEDTFSFLRTRTFSHQVDRLFQRHQLAAQPLDRHGLDELVMTKHVKTAS